MQVSMGRTVPRVRDTNVDCSANYSAALTSGRTI